MQTIRCHCCGAILGDVPELSRLRHVLSKREFEVIEIIFNAKERGVTIKDISLKMYGERIGLVENKYHEVRVFIHWLRRKIEPFGFFIPTAMRDKIYRVQPLEVAA
ncbi:helix-turn-helix domain-containing protein [Agrobacterium rhizogenes]|nr:helix-turn-helix domain-containing protein [Rhizobium rhizogenes]NTJ77395.1 helix-turn-helix domain-containing protein [Rhizobium rhizogenes]